MGTENRLLHSDVALPKASFPVLVFAADVNDVVCSLSSHGQQICMLHVNTRSCRLMFLADVPHIAV